MEDTRAKDACMAPESLFAPFVNTDVAGYAQVVLDIPTRTITSAFTYSIPARLAEAVEVGCSVLVYFGNSPHVGYVVELLPKDARAFTDTCSGAPCAIKPDSIKPIQDVLAPSAFSHMYSRLAFWMAREYACPLPSALRLLLPPGQTIKIRRSEDTSSWQLVCETKKPADERWVRLADDAQTFVPKQNARVQQRVLDALAQGPVRMAEFSVLISGARAAIKSLAARGVVVIESHKKIRSVSHTTLSSAHAQKPQHLTEGQKEALSAILHAFDAHAGDVVLIDGVTGSGKTEVYLQAIERARAQGFSALVLVPEISLTAQTVGRFRSRFGDDVAILHSRLSVGERYDQWMLIRDHKAHVVVGARSALFSPIDNLGLVILDEEHDRSYKQELAPRYHAREVACMLAKLAGCAVVLGSATPSYEALERCAVGTYNDACWTRVAMHERATHALLPAVSIVDMRKEFAAHNTYMFSRELMSALEDVVAAKKKAMVLINRRGFSNFLMCRACGCVPTCPHCSLTLTYHEHTHELKCHECDRAWSVYVYPNPLSQCMACGSRYVAAFGCGTQQVQSELERIFADRALIVRMDADSTAKKGAHQALLEQFDNASCAILVGTQMIAKGLDFPDVVLVGVLNADTSLKMCDFRAAEQTYFLLEQVAGRAGRGSDPGRVIIQSYWATHPIMQALVTHNRSQFVQGDLKDRRDAYYPPYSRVANVIVWSRSLADVEAYVARVAAAIRDAVLHEDGRWDVLGPSDCLKSKVNDRYRKHVLVKAPLAAPVGSVLSRAMEHTQPPSGMRIAIDVDALDCM